MSGPRSDGRGATGELLAAARSARGVGICVIPAATDGSKAPWPDGRKWTRWQSELPDDPTLEGWFKNGRYTGMGVVCGAVSRNLEMFEFEGRAVDEGVLDAFIAAAEACGLGELCQRVAGGYEEATPSGGVHWLYRCEQLSGNSPLARRPATPAELEIEPKAKIKVLIETRGEGGFTITAPSNGTTHPTGRAWTQVSGGFGTVVTITGAERLALHTLAATFDQMPAREPSAPKGPAHRDVETWALRPGDDFNARTTWPEVLEPAGWARIYDRGDIAYWRRPGANTKGHDATTNGKGTDHLKVFSTSTEFDTDRTYDRFGAYAVLEHDGDLTAAAKALQANGYGMHRDTPKNDEPRHTITARGTSEVPAMPELPVLPNEFWAARPTLEHIRLAARARLIGPDALLGAVLTRVCVYSDFRLVLPPVVGRIGSLNLAVGLAGRSGAGKGSVADESRRLVGEPDVLTAHGEAPAGSGEGMVRSFFELVADPEDRRRRILTRQRDSMLIRVDEGETLRSLAQRQGQTTWQVIRQSFSGETLGGSYVDETRRARLEAHTYRLALLMCIQPELAQFLFDDVVGGTPQRFAWFSTADPGAPDIDDLPPHPGQILWRPPNLRADPEVAERTAVGADGQRRLELGVDADIVKHIRHRQHEILLGGEVDPLDSHAELLRLKLAALLALFEGRIDVTLDDWHLAGLITATSNQVRASMLAAIAADSRRRIHAANERAAEKAARVENARAAATVDITRVARVIARHVARHVVRTGGDEERCNRRCLTQAVRSSDRDQYGAALGVAVANDWVTEVDGEYGPGESRPA